MLLLAQPPARLPVHWAGRRSLAPPYGRGRGNPDRQPPASAARPLLPGAAGLRAGPDAQPSYDPMPTFSASASTRAMCHRRRAAILRQGTGETPSFGSLAGLG